MPSKVLNTNMGLGFQRGRKYDTDLDRLGRMETSHGELRKTRDLNLQTELKKLKNSMKEYSIKRFSSYPYQVLMTEDELRAISESLQKEFGMGDVVGGVVDGVRDAAGNVVEGAGKVIGSGAGKLAAGGFGMVKGAGIGASLLGSFAPGIGHVLGGIGGALLGGKLGSSAAGAVGSTLKGIGQDIHS